MKHAVEMGSDARIYGVHTKFHKYYFRNSNVNTEGFTDTQTAWSSHKRTFILFFFQKKESRLKMVRLMQCRSR
jgi:hypothetical protein